MRSVLIGLTIGLFVFIMSWISPGFRSLPSWVFPVGGLLAGAFLSYVLPRRITRR